MMTDGPRHDDDRPARSKRSLASRIVWVISILVVVAGLLFLGWVYSVGQLLGEPGGTYLEIENRTNQTVKIFRFIEGYEGRFFYGKIPPHSAFAYGGRLRIR